MSIEILVGSLLLRFTGANSHWPPAETQDGICETASGGYFIEMPEAENPPLVVFLHGYGGSGTGTMNNRDMVDPLLERGDMR